MKLTILLLPTLLLLGFTAVLATPFDNQQSAITRTQRDAEIAQLREQCEKNQARLNVLEASGHNFVPR
jgi:hypothetical protein